MLTTARPNSADELAPFTTVNPLGAIHQAEQEPLADEVLTTHKRVILTMGDRTSRSRCLARWKKSETHRHDFISHETRTKADCRADGEDHALEARRWGPAGPLTPQFRPG